jgi:PAS domain S-box-containing protein
LNAEQAVLQQENESLRARLAEAESRLVEAQEVIAAIRSGDVDAVVVSGPDGEQIFTLRGAESAYRALIEAMNEGAATVGSDGTLIYCNQRLADMLGFPLDQVMGRPVLGLVGFAAMETIAALLDRALRGLSAKTEIGLQSADGRLIPAQVSISRMRGEEPIALCMVVTDLTESKKWEELISAGKLTKSILDSSAEGIAVCDRNGHIVILNGILKRLCGSNPILEHFDTAFPLETKGECDQPVLFTISSSLSRRIQTQEVTYRRKDGAEFALLLSSGQIADSSGINGCVLTLTDITERKRIEQALLRSEKLAAVGRLAASIAHEINNPLEAVVNLLFIARGAEDLSEIRQYLDSADRELSRVSAITTQTLRFHRQSTTPTEVTCDSLIEAAISIFQGRILNSDIQVEQRSACRSPIHCFEGEIRQVLSNLIGNAIDAMHPRGGRLLLRSREGRDRAGRKGVILTVADNGSGMSRETSAKAFEPFFSTKGSKGTGLGLWVCQEIVSRHGGRLRLRSSQRHPANGTVITIFLPLAAVSR